MAKNFNYTLKNISMISWQMLREKAIGSLANRSKHTISHSDMYRTWQAGF